MKDIRHNIRLLKSRRVRFGALSVILILLVFVLGKTPAMSSIGSFAQHQTMRLGTSVTNIWRWIFTEKAQLQDEIKLYRQLAEEHIVSEVELELARQQIAELQTLLEYTQTYSIPTVAAKILSYSQKDSELLIDKGNHDEITESMPVLADGQFLVGIVNKIYPQSAVIRLLSSKETKIAVRIVSEETPIGIVYGTDGFLLRIDLIPKDHIIQSGDIITTAGIQQNLPDGIVIGTVEEVIDDDISPFKSATVRPAVDPHDISAVMILRTNTYD